MVDQLCYVSGQIKHLQRILEGKFQNTEGAQALLYRAAVQIAAAENGSQSENDPDYEEVIRLHVQLAHLLEENGRENPHLKIKYLERYDYVFGPVLGFINHSILLDALEREVSDLRNHHTIFEQNLADLTETNAGLARAIKRTTDLQEIQEWIARANDWIRITKAFFSLKPNRYGELVIPTFFDNWYKIEHTLVSTIENLQELRQGLRWQVQHLDDLMTN